MRCGRGAPVLEASRVWRALVVSLLVAPSCGLNGNQDSQTESSGAGTGTPTALPSISATLDRSSYPVVVGPDSVAGWWTGERWVRAEGRMAEIPALEGESYKIVRLSDPITIASGSAPRAGCETVPGAASIEMPGLGRDLGLGPPPIAVSEVDDPRPRRVEELDPSAEVYRNAAAELLRQKGIDDAGDAVVQVVMGDLEGDGRNEVVVVAERIDDAQGLFGRPGDFSVVFLRRVVDDKPVASVVKESLPDPEAEQTPFVMSHRISAMADLNGDGRMEIAVSGRYYEGAEVSFHEVGPDGAVSEVLSSGCGA